MSKKGIIAMVAIVVIAIAGIVFFTVVPAGVRTGNKIEYNARKADDVSNYETLKEVEDTCRAMIASYEADKITYEQYKDSEDKQERSWATAAKIRANQTASTYNNYMLKNSFVWEDNIPSDIKTELPVLE